MENLNYIKHNNSNRVMSSRSPLEKLLSLCMDFNTDISHIYLKEDDVRLVRSLAEWDYYQFKFNELGIELVSPRYEKEEL